MNEVIVCIFGSGDFDRAVQGILGAGRRLADEIGVPLHALVVGSSSSEEIGKIADAVTVADQPELGEYQTELVLSALTQFCTEQKPRAVLLSNDTYSQELAPRLAHRLNGSAAGDVVEIRASEPHIRVTRSVYGGKASAVIELKRSPAILWIRARAFEPTTARAGEPANIVNVKFDLPVSAGPRIVERNAQTSGETRLEDARVIVSGGRGLGGAEPFKQLQELAHLIGAQMAASRAACDAGWVPPSWQVGQTGKKVAPGLYMAIAIHGASQHLAGISDAKAIAAINIDPDAPIFKHCRFGIVEDYRKVVPLLCAKLAAMDR